MEERTSSTHHPVGMATVQKTEATQAEHEEAKNPS